MNDMNLLIAQNVAADWQALLQQQGYYCCNLPSQAAFEPMAATLGQVIWTTEVVVKPESRALVTSDRALDFHTDHHRADFIAWYCFEQTDHGGETLLLDTWSALQALTPPQLENLASIFLMEHAVFEGDPPQYPLLEWDGDTPSVYYSFWLVKDGLTTAQTEALQAFKTALKATPHQHFHLQKGDCLVINNRRMLHGRRAILGSKKRHLRRLWIQKDNQNLIL